MSDLQCPARFVVVAAPDAATAAALRHERVAAVYEGPTGTVAAELARALGLPVRLMARPIAVDDVLRRTPEAMRALGELADLHRGETAVVAVDGNPGRRVEVTLDGDGVTVAEVSPGDAR